MVAADGSVVGTLVEMFISADWRVEAIRIDLRDDIAERVGAKRSFLRRATIELPTTFVQSVGDAVVLAIDVEHLREAHRPPTAATTDADAIPQPVS